nr:M23 family metallopeptidase [Demequina gelatinilytica]
MGPRLRASLALVLAAALTASASATAAPPALSSPLAPMRAHALFVAPAQPWAAGHRGIDLEAVPGQAVTAPGPGVVAFAGRVVDRGVVTVDHGNGVVTSLEPVAEPPAVGTAVARGEEVGVVGSEPGHCAPATCLHWGVRVDGGYTDPLDLLEGFGPVRLLPLAPASGDVGAQEKAPVRTSDSRSFFTAAEWICDTRDSVTPRIDPICASVRFS